MRTITLLRHAKSSWMPTSTGGTVPSDKARPLAPRGQRDAPRMAQWMAAHGIRPDHVLCSTALRTRETLELVTDAVVAASAGVAVRDDLYLAEAGELLRIVRALPAAIGHVMLIGHDPGIHDAAQLLTGTGDPALRRHLAQKFPTASVAVIDFDAAQWRDIAFGSGRLRLFMSPRQLPA
jgi:phosphohistidine phosphatase